MSDVVTVIGSSVLKRIQQQQEDERETERKSQGADGSSDVGLDDTLVCEIGENDDGMLINLTTGGSFLAPISKGKHSCNDQEDQSPQILNNELEKEQNRNEDLICNSPVPKRPRISHETDGGNFAVALSPSIDDWEIPKPEVFDSLFNNSLYQSEAYESFSLKLKGVLEGLEKKLKGTAAISLPFPNESFKKVEETLVDLKSNCKEVEIQADLISEEEKAEMVLLKKLVEDQQNSLLERNQELENARRTIQQKEIGFAAATTLLGISFEECIRKSIEAQTVRAAIMAPPIPSASPNPPAPAPPAPLTNNVQSLAAGHCNFEKLEVSNSSITKQSTNTNITTSVTSLPAGCKIGKDEYSRRNRNSTNGVYEEAFPLQPEILKRFAADNSAADFVRLLLEHCFTDEYLVTTTPKRINVDHTEAIIDATLAHFREFRTRKDTQPQPLNRVIVEQFISRVIQNRKATAKRRSLK